jgi:hypothetical protein
MWAMLWHILFVDLYFVFYDLDGLRDTCGPINIDLLLLHDYRGRILQ